jgi:fucose permease
VPFWLIHAVFLLTGAVTTLLGPILPLLVSWWALDDWHAGLLFTLQFVGSMAGVALSSAAMNRRGFRFTLVLGVLLMATGVATVGAGAQALGVAGVLCYGVGLGVTMPATNMFVAESQPDRRAAALNVLNFAWGLGAIGLPPAVALFQRTSDVRVLLFLLAGALACAAIVVSRGHFSAGVARQHVAGEAHPMPRGASLPHALLFGAILFFYVGTETSVSGWIALYTRRLAVASTTAAMAMPSVFWATLLAGRAVAPLILRRVAETQLAAVGIVISAAGVAVLLAADSAFVLAAGVAASGLGCATVFPITIALFTRDFGNQATRYAGLVFALSALGGATLPWLVGAVSSHTGALKAGLAVPLAGCVAVLVLHTWRVRRSDH